jgi:hypothetical protein
MVRFRSTHLNTLLDSPARGPLTTVVDPAAAAGPASGRGCRLVLEKSVGCTGPTSIHNRYSGIQQNDIYKKT